MTLLRLLCVCVTIGIGIRSVNAINAPSGPTSTQPYSVTLDPNTSNPPWTSAYAATDPRATAWWDFTYSTSNYPAKSVSDGRAAPPALVPFNGNGLVVTDDVGVAAHNLTTAQIDLTDRSIRLTGTNGDCLKAEGFNSILDVCLANPYYCELTEGADSNTGLSFSMWVNLPQEFMAEPRYLIDTGANEIGGAGVAVYFTGSTDGRRFTHQITILVSTGDKFWKVVLNGMTRPYSWNNIGVRFSKDAWTAGNGAPYGLQVFVNNTQVAWKQYETATVSATTPAAPALSDVKLNVGCKLDGTRPMLGKMDNLAFWYWQLPSTHIQWFTGGIQHSQAHCVNCYIEDNTVNPVGVGVAQPAGWEPWQYVEERMRLAQEAAADEYYLDDTSLAKEGDCLVGDTSTWGDGGDDGRPHPIDCADTRIEIQGGLELDNEYSGHELVKAIIRTVNRAGESGLSQDDMNYIWDVAVPAAYAKLYNTIALKRDQARVYAHLVVALSKVIESEYDGMWDEVIGTNKQAGVIRYLDDLDRFALTTADKIVLTGAKSEPIPSANNESALVLLKIRAKDVTKPFIYPDYSITIKRNNETEPYYDFPLKRKEHWGLTRDWIRVPKEAITGAYDDGTTEIRLVGKLYNRMVEHMPGILHPDVTGTGTAVFNLNSRVISASMAPAVDNYQPLIDYPIEFVLAHVNKQEDAPYKKGAVLCVYWDHQNGTDYGGSWDTFGCTLHSTNDTHSVCRCTHMSDFAVLLEDYTPPGRLPDALYYICYVLYAISLILLGLFMFYVLTADRLHYELHIVHWNCALALFLAICFYLMTLFAKDQRLGCIAVSVFLHYFYTSAYLWLTLCAHYVFRSITSGKLGGKIMTWYSYIGWGGPALLVVLLVLIDVSRYGIGDRCLGAHNDHFLWIYVGIILAMAFCTAPLIIIAAINMTKMNIKDPIDRADISWSLWGLMIMWPFIFCVWIFIVFIYLAPLNVQMIDWLFELFNSLQGIVFFIAFGVLVPSGRLAIRTCARGDGRVRAIVEEDEIYPDLQGDFMSDWSPPTTTAGQNKTDVDGVLADVNKKRKKKNKVAAADPDPEWKE